MQVQRAARRLTFSEIDTGAASRTEVSSSLQGTARGTLHIHKVAAKCARVVLTCVALQSDIKLLWRLHTFLC